LRVCLDGADFVADVIRGLGRLLGKFLYFIGDNGKTFSGFSGARGFDGRVEGEQVCLFRNRRNNFDHDSDFRAGLTEFGDGVVRGLGGINGGRFAASRALLAML